MEELEDSIQMWLESYNTYHLVDGAAMKEAWGSIMPHIMLAEKNLNAILDQVTPLSSRIEWHFDECRSTLLQHPVPQRLTMLNG
jgi:hypothetical protein